MPTVSGINAATHPFPAFIGSAFDSPETSWVIHALRGEADWPPANTKGDPSERIMASAERNYVRELLHAKVRDRPIWHELPEELRRALTHSTRRSIARELFMEVEIVKDLDALAAAGIETLLLKGTALAYTLYPTPGLRPRCDVDLLLRDKATADKAWGILAKRGYRRDKDAVVDGDFVSHQYSCARHVVPQAGIVLDVHWKLSNSNFFANKFNFDALYAERMPIPALGPNAYALSLPVALLHALFHRLNHVGNGDGERLIWFYDIDLICRNLSPDQWRGFSQLVAELELGPICLDGLNGATALYGTSIPEPVRARITPRQPGAYRQLALKHPGFRRILFELNSLGIGFAGLRYLRENLFPARRYMEKRFGATGYPTLAAAYVRRIWRGTHKQWRKRQQSRGG